MCKTKICSVLSHKSLSLKVEKLAILNCIIAISTCWHDSHCTQQITVWISLQCFSKLTRLLRNEKWINPNYNTDRMTIDYTDFSNRWTIIWGPCRANIMSDLLQFGILTISYSRILVWCQESFLLSLQTNVLNTTDNPNADLKILELSVLI